MNYFARVRCCNLCCTAAVSDKDVFLKKLGFTPYKAEQLLQGMELQEKEAQKD